MTTQEKIDKGYIMEWPACGKLSAYAWGDVDDAEGIAHISCSSSFEWQCGHCKLSFTEVDSPINCECYTHNPE